MSGRIFGSFCLMVLLLGTSRSWGDGLLTFRGASDASAAVALDVNMVAVADDETNQIRLYDVSRPGLPVSQVDVTSFAVIDAEHPELDLEGAARVGERVYWIGSHGRNKDGKPRPNRACLFATDIKTTLNGPTLVPEGHVYRDLLDDLLLEPAFKTLQLERAVLVPATIETGKKQRERLAPKDQGLNIEALAIAPEGRGLYIGFRNPRPRGQALIVLLINAEAVVLAEAQPQFAPPILLDLKGKGLRSMDFVPALKAYLLVAGDHDGKSQEFVLYRWSGRVEDKPKALRSFAPPQYDLTIEALVTFPTWKRILLLSDDGTRKIKIDGREQVNKELSDLNQRTFRGLWLDLDT